MTRKFEKEKRKKTLLKLTAENKDKTVIGKEQTTLLALILFLNKNQRAKNISPSRASAVTQSPPLFSSPHTNTAPSLPHSYTLARVHNE